MPIKEYDLPELSPVKANAVVKVSGPMAVLKTAAAPNIGELSLFGERIPDDLGEVPEEEFFGREYDGEDEDLSDENEFMSLIASLSEEATVRESEYYVAEASLTAEDGNITLSYRDLDEDDPFAYTEISFSEDCPGRICIVHTGIKRYIFVIEENVRHICAIEGGNAPQVVICGERVDNRLTETGGEMKIEFSIESAVLPRATASINYEVNLVSDQAKAI